MFFNLQTTFRNLDELKPPLSQHLLAALIEQHYYINCTSAFHSSESFGGLGGDFLLHPLLFTCVVFPHPDRMFGEDSLAVQPLPAPLGAPGPQPFITVLSAFTPAPG